jgi:hypothetical protein
MSSDTRARFRAAIDAGLRLGRRIEEIETVVASGDHKAMMMEQLADDWVALLAEYPDVFPNPPISIETLRAHAEELKRASEEARKAEAAHVEASARVAEAERAMNKTINEIAAPRRKPEKPS